ncbi:MAG: vitamin B12-dependent ribonucleotide reductase, partial [Treponema sp.]|nr:vitamin B12-dependent ribonucleotide reductase [Treponema sp.]
DLLATGTKNDSAPRQGNSSGDRGQDEKNRSSREKDSAGFKPMGIQVVRIAKTGSSVKPGTSGVAPDASPLQPASRNTGNGLPQNDAAKITEARIKGYEGDPCPNCGSLTLVRNGTCMKCDTCGGTTGCS